MARLIEIKTMQDYREVVETVLLNGTFRSPRGEDTVDLGTTTVVLEHPELGLATGTGRGLSTRVAATEAVQLIGAFHDPALMLWASPNFSRYMDGDKFHGAYGRRIGVQMSAVHRKLSQDSQSRQAVVTLWDPEQDNALGLHDYPCTVALGFSRGAKGLDMNVTMRSNDVWLGFPYDVFQFTQLQLSLAKSLGWSVGYYTHTAWSLHLYVKDTDAAERLILTKPEDTFQPQGLGRTSKGFAVTRGLAQMLPYLDDQFINTPDPASMKLNESEMWYHGQFAAFRARPTDSASPDASVVG